jgi:hypothetical protein
MGLWVLLGMVFVFGLVASALPSRPPPQQVIVLQALEPAPPAETGCLPLLIFVGVVAVAVALL